jgi:hypothetical protein
MNKQEIINNYSKSQFISFLENDNESKILELFNQEGQEILKNSKLKEERIKCILTYSKYKNQLLQNTDFLDILLSSNINKFYAVLKDLDTKTYEVMLNRCIQLNIDENTISRLFTFFSDEFKLQVIKNKTLNISLIVNIFNKSHNSKIVQEILNTYDIDLTNEKVNVISLFEKSKKTFLKNSVNKTNELIIIHPNLITKKLAERLWNECDIFKLRKVLIDAQYATNIDTLNEYTKLQEEKNIKETTNEILTYPYNEIYNCYKIYKEQEYNFNNDKLNYNEQLYNEMKTKYESLCKDYNIKKSDLEITMNSKTNEINNNSIKELFNYLKILSDRNISNYIIDYHFEENYHNIILDMTELLQYNSDGNITLAKDRIELYEKIINIDYLSLEEKQKLHEKLKQYNMMEMFYDDMRYARDIVAETIKDYSISKESIEQYKDEELSKQYGVDIYNMNGQPFFAIVKTGRKLTNKYPTGHSFSLIGTNGIAVFGNKTYAESYIYDSNDLTKEQIVHVFPYDSYTRFKPFELIEEASMRVNTLMSPQKLTTHSNSYNEILVLEHGTEETYMDEYTPQLKQIALYCLDEITQQDIEEAQKNNVGIMLVNSKKYQEYGPDKNTINTFDQNKYNYFDGVYEKDYYEERRR